MKNIEREELIKKLLFSNEAAEYLGITKQRLCVLTKNKKIKCLKNTKACNLYHIDDLDEYLNKRNLEKKLKEELWK